MASINFDQLFSSLLSGVESLAVTTLKDYEAAAKADGARMLQEIKTNLMEWTSELETGSLTPEDFKYLLLENKDVAEMDALKQSGLAEVRTDEFRNNVLNLVLGTVLGLVKL